MATPLPRRWRTHCSRGLPLLPPAFLMNVDVQTLLEVMIVNLFAIALALPVALGWRVSVAARCVQASAIAQFLAWVSFAVASSLGDRLFSSLCMALLGASLGLMWCALQRWLGARPGGRLLALLAVLTPLGYAAGFDSYTFRVGWSNFGLAAEMVVVCTALAWPSPRGGLRWRALVFIALAGLALVTAWRGVLGGFYPELYPYYRAPHPVNLAAALWNHLTVMLTTIGLLAAWREEAESELRLQATTDGLTGLLNRRAFRELAAAALVRGDRYRVRHAVLMLDIDHFKRINDEHGHAAGDDVLVRFAEALRAALRRGDLACRYGGEEFCVLLSHADAAAAAGFHQRLVDETKRRFEAAGIKTPTFSAGLAVTQPQREVEPRPAGAALDALLAHADAALYRAKAGGRNRLAGEALGVRAEPVGA